jgi:excisionase family DNA binding protein
MHEHRNSGSDPDLRKAAQCLNIPLDTLRRRAQRGRIAAYKAGGRWFIPVQDVLRDSVPAVQAEQTWDSGVNNERVGFLQAEVERLHAELERVWAEVHERDALIERLTRPALVLPAPIPAETPRQHWWRRLFRAS